MSPGGPQTVEALTIQLNDLRTQMKLGHGRIDKALQEMLAEVKKTNGRVTGLEQREYAEKAVREYAEASGHNRASWTQWALGLLIGLIGGLVAAWIHH